MPRRKLIGSPEYSRFSDLVSESLFLEVSRADDDQPAWIDELLERGLYIVGRQGCNPLVDVSGMSERASKLDISGDLAGDRRIAGPVDFLCLQVRLLRVGQLLCCGAVGEEKI